MLTATEIISPRTRGDITRELARTQKWTGSRHGFRFYFRRAIVKKQAVILWSIRQRKVILAAGQSDTVFEASQAISVTVEAHQTGVRKP